jgi:thymidylate kinase
MRTDISRRNTPNSGPLIISFSGVDGAGKSTQIDALCASLADAGVEMKLLRFWDDVTALGKFREISSHLFFKSEKGIGAREKPVNRRDKNVQSWYMTFPRFGFYFLDALRLKVKTAKLRRAHSGVVIFDRYLYDELANLPPHSHISSAYIKLLIRFGPRPHIAYLLDADPARARERKPEYPLEFIHKNRASYLRLSVLAGMRVVAPGAVDEVAECIRKEVFTDLRSQISNPPTICHSTVAAP